MSNDIEVKPIGKHLEGMSEKDLLDGGYTTQLKFDPKNICPNCGDNRMGKGSLISSVHGGQAFCNESCYEEWHSAVMAKNAEKYQ